MLPTNMSTMIKPDSDLYVKNPAGIWSLTNLRDKSDDKYIYNNNNYSKKRKIVLRWIANI